MIRKFIALMNQYNDLINEIETKKRRFGQEELYASEIHTLVYIHDHETSSFSEVATGMTISKGALTKLVNKLEAKSLLERYKLTDDKKRVYFRITEKGKASYQAHKVFHEKHQILLSDDFKRFIDENETVLNEFFDYTSQTIRDLKDQVKIYVD